MGTVSCVPARSRLSVKEEGSEPRDEEENRGSKSQTAFLVGSLTRSVFSCLLRKEACKRVDGVVDVGGSTH